MKFSRLVALLLIVVFALISCKQDPEVEGLVQTPTIRGNVSIPNGSGLTGSDFFVRVMEGEKAIYTGKVNSDGSFSVQGLKENTSYSILLTTDEPGDIAGSSRDVSRVASTSGYGGWMSNVVASMDKQAGVGSIKVKPLGTIKGKVTKDGAADGYDTTVYIPGTSYLAMTDSEGNFSIFNVPQATYTLRFISNGYMSKMVEQVVLYSDDDTENPVTTLANQMLIKNVGNLIGSITKMGASDSSGITVMLSNDRNVYTDGTSVDGSLLMSGLVPGVYTATISSSGFVTRMIENVEISAARNTSLDPIMLVANGGRITGSVTMNDGGDVSGVLITARSSDDIYSYTTSTDEAGDFIIADVYPGSYSLTLTKTGYAIMTKRDNRISAGQETAAGIFEFSSDYGTVEGRVTDKDGNGIENAIVKIGEISIFTDGDGDFSKTGIPLGNHSVSVSKDGYSTKVLSGEITVESSKTTNLGTAKLVSIYGSISGRVTVNDGGSVEAITVTASAEGFNSVSVATDSQGRYSFVALQPGSYTVRAEVDGYSIATRTVVVSADAETTADVLVLSSFYGMIEGIVTDTRGNAIENAIVKVGEINILTGTDGRFSKTGIPVGNYSVTISKEGYTTKTLAGNITIASTETISIGTVRLASVLGSISGTVNVNDGGSVEAITVTASAEGFNSVSVATDSQGRYSFVALQPGSYTVRAEVDGYSIATKTVVVTADSETTADALVLSSSYGVVTGIVTDTQGNAIENAIVKVGEINILTGADGRFSKTGIPVGNYSVTVSREGYTTKTLAGNITVESSNTVSLESIELVSIFGSVSGKTSLQDSVDNSGVIITLTYVADSNLTYSAVSGVDGTYTFSNLTKAGQYTVTFSKAGYISRTGIVANVVFGENQVLDDASLITLVSKVKGRATLEGANDHSGISVLLKASDNSVQYDATTDQHGNWVLARVNPGEYTLIVSKSGYVSITVNSIIVESSTIKELEPTSLNVGTRSVIGSVVLELREDYSGAVVTATNLADSQIVYSAISNSAGNYTIAGMNPGEYYITISCAGYNSVTLPTINVIDGSEMVLEPCSIPIARGIISGSATLEGRETNAGVKVELMKGSEVYATTLTDDAGLYVFSVPQGNYSGVRLTCENFRSVSIPQDIALIANDSVVIGTDVNMIATHVPNVKGRLTVRGLLNLDYSGIDVSIVELGLKTETDMDGYWSFSKVPVGHYTLKFERENTNTVTELIDIVAAAEKNTGTIELIPNAASIEGHVTLNSVSDYSGITVRATAEGMAELSTKTNAAGYFYLGNLVTTETYTVHFEKDGWVSQTREVSGLENLSINDITISNPVSLSDTTVPILNSITVVVGNTEQEGRRLNVYFNASDSGSDLKTVLVNTSDNFEGVDPQAYSNPLSIHVEDIAGDYNLYAKVLDAAGNVSTIAKTVYTITDYKTVVSGVLIDNEDGINDGIITWTKAKSPYYVTNNIMVEEGLKLVIEPGVNIQFSGDFYIHVNGELSAIGTESEVISFYGVGYGEDSWTGINCVDGKAVISNASLTGMAKGVCGPAEIFDSTIASRLNGFALGGKTVFTGSVRDSIIMGAIDSSGSEFFNSKISCNQTKSSIKNSFIGNCIIDGGILETIFSVFENTSLERVLLTLSEVKSRYTSFKDCSMVFIHGGDYKYCEFNDSVFSQIKFDSSWPGKTTRINECNMYGVSSEITAYEIKTSNSNNGEATNLDMRRNYWGGSNTLELSIKGEYADISFFTDYFDDFNRARIDYSDYKTEAIPNIGYIGDSYYDQGSSTIEFGIGDRGPAGGYVFYDKGYYSEGWRYLEASPEVIGPTIFGYIRDNSLAGNHNAITSLGIGRGKENTRALVEWDYYDEESPSNASRIIENVPAKLCYEYVFGGYSDWFLPSYKELRCVYLNLQKPGITNYPIGDYWTSSEKEHASDCWTVNFSTGNSGTIYKKWPLGTIAVRAF